MPFHTFCSAKFSTCIAVRLLKFSVLHGKGESKYRPVATNFQCLKNCCPHGLALVGVRLLHLLRKPCCHSKAPLGLSLLRCASQTRSMRFERSGRGQEPSRGHKFSIFENLVLHRDFTSSMHLHFRSDLVGACLPQTLLMVRA